MDERLEYLEETVNNSDYFRKKQHEKKNRTSMRFLIPSFVTTKFIDGHDEMEGLEFDDDADNMTSNNPKKCAKVKAFEAMRESDSVQRAMIDLHRRSKLLNNFAIMNSTGFIKIVKKFDKTFPLRKGLFKEISSNGFICNDGTEISTLSEKMVSNDILDSTVCKMEETNVMLLFI